MADVPLVTMHKALEEKKIKFDEDGVSDYSKAESCNQTPYLEVSTNPGDIDNDRIQQSDWVFVDQEEVPEYMKCNIICCNVFAAPQLLTCCGKNVCKRCIDSHVQRAALSGSECSRTSCPHCRKKDFRSIPNTALELSINLLKVECPYRKSGCGWSGPLKQGKLHLRECMFIPVDCPNQCGCPKFERGKLHDHVATCPLQHINCPFQGVGCDSGAVFLRTEWNQGRHGIDNLHQHLLLIAQENARISSSCKSLSNLTTGVHQERIKENTEIIQSQNRILEFLRLGIKSLGDRLQVTNSKLGSLKHMIAAGKICLAELERKSKQVQDIKYCVVGTIEEVQSLPVPKPIGMESVQPVEFIIDKFRKRMTLNDMWLSPPFYTHRGGYKMCISVQPNGFGDGYKKYVSATIHLLMGEYDDHLRWPFPGAIITLSAIPTQRAYGNVNTVFELTGIDTIHTRSKQLDGGLGCGLKVSKFLKHRTALSYYIARDCLQLMVYPIQFLPVILL